jgi:hypothetical protein
MAKNTGKGYRRGAVKNRTEFQWNGGWFKRSTENGQIMNRSDHQHKGVTNEKRS